MWSLPVSSSAGGAADSRDQIGFWNVILMNERALNKRWLVILPVVVWIGLSILFTFVPTFEGEHINPVHCLILAALPLVVLFPTSIESWVQRSWFPLAFAFWLGSTIPLTLFTFKWIAGLSGRCDRAYIISSVLAFAFFVGYWIIGVARRRATSASRCVAITRPTTQGQ